MTDWRYVKGIRRLAIVFFVLGALGAGALVVSIRDQSTLSSAGTRVRGTVSKRWIHEEQHSDNIPTKYYSITADYPVGKEIRHKEFEVSYETFNEHPMGGPIDIRV